MRLTVIIPAIGTQQAIEDSLVSVLSNRPLACEVLVVCDYDYVDPYAMDEEVRFVRCGHGGSWAKAANQGLQVSGATYIAVLLPGTEVVEGWAHVALRRMDRHARLASVAPLLLDESVRSSHGIAGLRFTLGGRRKIRTVRVPQVDDEPALFRIDGPCRWAGFYRRQALLEADGWDVSIAPELVALELAQRLRTAGWRSLCELSSWVRVRDVLDREVRGYQGARDTERIFWRYVTPASRIPAVLIHPLAVLAERLRQITNRKALGELLGRISGLRQVTRQGVPPRTGRPAQRRAA